MNPTEGLRQARRDLTVERLVAIVRAPYFRSVGAQALVSAFHFALNLYLVRAVVPHAYGTFAFALVIALFAAAINNALIATPLAVWTPVIKDDAERTRQERLFSSLNLVLFGVLLTATAFATGLASDTTTLRIGVPLHVAVYAARQYTRSLGYARLRPLVTATGDTTYVVVAMLNLATLIAIGDGADVGLVLVALALANLAAMAVETTCLNGRVSFVPVFEQWRDRYGPIWQQARWALLGALTTLFLGQAHGVVINSAIGPEAFAPLAAGFVLFGPVRVALLTWQNMVKPEMAIAIDRRRGDTVRRQSQRSTILMLIAVSGMGMALALGWPWVHALLYEARYADEPMALIVALWFAVTLASTCYCAPGAALQAMRAFRPLAIATLYGALISGVAVVVLLAIGGATATLVGILLAETVVAIYLSRLLHRRLGELS